MSQFRREMSQFRPVCADHASLACGMQTCAAPQMSITVPIYIQVSPGELLDRISILEIKAARIRDTVKRDHVRLELDTLNDLRGRLMPDLPELHEMHVQLSEINARLWDIEDAIRVCGSTPGAEAQFMALARSVYQQNDARSRVKAEINTLLNSSLVEVKVYSTHTTKGAGYG